MMQTRIRFVSLLAATAWIASALTGCGTAAPGGGGTSPINPTPSKIAGHVDTGTQAVAGATVQLYAVGNTGLKSLATPLISQDVMTSSDGSFDITAGWNCTNTAAYGNDPLLYIVATGGNAGGSANGSNSALTMMSALGRCSTVTSANFIYVNEVTTVAAVYALSPFMADLKHVGAPAAGMQGLANAFSSAKSLADTTTGASPGSGVAAGTMVPSSQVNTLANVIATCVNSAGGAACSKLFASITAAGGATPTDTIAFLLQLVHNPSQNAATVYSFNASTAPFQPSVAAPLNDWSLAIQYKGGGLNGPAGIAIDANGNAWVANSGSSSLTAIGGQGSFLTGANGFAGDGRIIGAQAVAVDRSGNVWLADTLLSSVIRVTTTGNGMIQSSTSYTSGISGPTSLAVDGQNRIWVANFGDGSIAELDANGAPVGASPLRPAGVLQHPFGIAIDGAGSAWVTDNGSSVVARFDTHQTLVSGAGFSDNALFAPLGIAIDTQGRAWVAGNGSNSATLLQADGSAAPASPYAGSPLQQPTSVAIDGAGIVWLTIGAASGGLASIQPTTAAVTRLGSLNTPAGVAVDASGNVWTANSGDDTVSKFIGVATPVQTPLAARAGP